MIPLRKAIVQDPFEKALLEDCEETDSINDTTHVQVFKSFQSIPIGVYEYHAAGMLVKDGLYIARFDTKTRIAKKVLSNGLAILLRHKKTYDELIEKGMITDKRSSVDLENPDEDTK